jgi:hypothetical protein
MVVPVYQEVEEGAGQSRVVAATARFMSFKFSNLNSEVPSTQTSLVIFSARLPSCSSIVLSSCNYLVGRFSYLAFLSQRGHRLERINRWARYNAVCFPILSQASLFQRTHLFRALIKLFWQADNCAQGAPTSYGHPSFKKCITRQRFGQVEQDIFHHEHYYRRPKEPYAKEVWRPDATS